MKHFILQLLVLTLFIGAVNAATEYDYIAIFVNDRVITRNEIDVRVHEIALQKKIDLSSSQQLQEIRKEVIDSLIEDTIIDIRADELMIRISDDQLDDEIDQFRKQRKLDQADFEELLERQQTSLADFRKTFDRQLRRNKVITREIRSKINVSTEKLKEIYEKDFITISRVHARHILLVLKSNAPKQKVQQVRERIVEIKKEILSGKSFQEMADNYSEDPSVKSNHGDLGFFLKKDMVKEFSEAAFELTPGRLSDPVRTKFGFHLIEVLEKKKDPGESFAKIKDKLYQQEAQKIFTEKFKQYIKDLREKVQIVKR